MTDSTEWEKFAVSASKYLPSLVVRSLPWILGFLLAHALPTSMIGDRWATEVHAGADVHHDPFDLSHGDASALLENPIEPRYDIAIATFGVFLVLLTILTRFAWGPIRDGLDRREATIAARIAEAETSAATAAKELAKYRAQIAAASDEARTIVAQGLQSAESQAARIVEQAQQEAQRERERAVAEIQAAKDQALREVARYGADLAVGLAGRILHREVRPDDHAALIREAIEQFPSQN
jgi:F-type H+-transporting ATPase subunit b